MGTGSGLGWGAGIGASLAMKPEGLPSDKKASLLVHMMRTGSPNEGGWFTFGLVGPL